jgi:hypothetical protein
MVSRSALLSRIPGEQPGSASYSRRIFDFQLSIANCLSLTQLATQPGELEIGSRKLAMTYVV